MDVLTGFGTEFPPGTQWRYSNSNYIALGRVIEAASGQPYAAYVRDHLAKPFGLASTSLCAPTHAISQPSRIEKDVLVAETFPDITFTDAAGALCSTPEDLLRWQQALFENKVVSPASLALMTLPGHTADGASTHYGAGLITDEVAGHKRIWHNGALAFGYRSQLAYYPDDDLQIVLLANTFGPRDTIGKLEPRLAHVALAIPVPPLDRALAAELAGTYGPPVVTIELRVIDDELHLLLASDGEDHVVIPHGKDVLAFEDAPQFSCRVLRTDGKVIAIELILGEGRSVRLDRH
jgi:CubicO group peptidase (beta-lactamase class C family)